MSKSLKKSIIVTLAVILIEFIVSVFIFNFDVRMTIVVITFLLCFLTGLCSLVFLCVKKWRRKLFVTVPVLICGIFVAVFYTEVIEIHLTKNPDRVAVREAKGWIKKHALQDGEHSYFKGMMVEPYLSMDIISYTMDEDSNYVFSCLRKDCPDTSYLYVNVSGEWNQYSSVDNVINICRLPEFDETMVELYKKIKTWKNPGFAFNLKYDDDYQEMCSEYGELISDMKKFIVEDINNKTVASSSYTPGIRHEYSLTYNNKSDLRMTDLKFIIYNTRYVNGLQRYDFYKVKDTDLKIYPRSRKTFSFVEESKNAGPNGFIIYMMPSEIYDDDWVEKYLLQSFDWENTKHSDGGYQSLMVSMGLWETDEDFFKELVDTLGKYSSLSLSSYMLKMFKNEEL